MKEILDFIIAKPSEAAALIAGMALVLRKRHEGQVFIVDKINDRSEE